MFRLWERHPTYLHVILSVSLRSSLAVHCRYVGRHSLTTDVQYHELTVGHSTTVMINLIESVSTSHLCFLRPAGCR